MLETKVRGEKVDKDDYKDALQDLRLELLEAQRGLRESGRGMMLLLTGSDARGIHECTNLLLEWLDPRGLEVHAMDEPTDEERMRPRYWRYWRRLPARGRLGVFCNAWTTRAIIKHLGGDLDKQGFDVGLSHARRFERMLANDGMVICKIWIDIDRDELEKRRKKAEKDKDEPWVFSEQDRKLYEAYDRSRDVVSYALRETHTETAPWQVVDGDRSRHRDLTVARIVRDAMRRAAEPSQPQVEPRHGSIPTRKKPQRLADVDLSQELDKKAYNERLHDAQRDLLKLSREARKQGRTTIMAFEGWDAAGKGGAIRRLMAATDAEHLHVIPIAKPTDEEYAHHYLWRFWRHLPRTGHIAIFDRSWHGRVLVERIEGFATETEWQRAYGEINEFEQQLSDHGILVLKFWLQIDADEQLRRFQERERTPHKMHKMTDEDYRNREKWDAYVDAIEDMIERTDTDHAPWHIVPGNDKRLARVTVAETVVKALKKHLD